MTVLSIPCPHCARPARVQADRLPDRPVSFACPHCKGKVIADKQKLLGSRPLAVEPATQADRRFLRLPPDAAFPSGIIVGEDDAAVADIQKALRSHRCELERVGSPELARQTIINEQPDLCLFVAGTITDPPCGPMAPLMGLPPAFRRRLYLALVADNVKTLDGNAAFLYQVNMTLARTDLSHLAAALYSGIDYHNRLYRPYFLAEAGG